MKIKTAEIQAVTGRRDQYPPDTMKEIAFAGRSNVGKSSLLNLLTGRKKLAKVSGSPGKTRTINFYLINNEFRIVDLPGYGYAKVAKSMSEDWGRMMDEYFQHRDGLVKVVQLVDIRHDPSKQDVQMYEYLNTPGRHYPGHHCDQVRQDLPQRDAEKPGPDPQGPGHEQRRHSDPGIGTEKDRA